MKVVLVLIHSPLVGPFTWSMIADELQQRQVETLVPALVDEGNREAPYWQQHVDAVVSALDALPTNLAPVLVGHSGAGALLPAIGNATYRPIAAYLFVDAGIPLNGLSRLDVMATEDPEFAQSLRDVLAAGGAFPTWTEEDLASVLPNPLIRRQLVAEVRPRSLDFFTEPIPVPSSWPDSPCAYLQFSPAYDAPAKKAREAGWPCLELNAGHFHMLVDPPSVATAIVELTATLTANTRSSQ
jgi:pimeloyl-ACP methyl ester carboxylesterase